MQQEGENTRFTDKKLLTIVLIYLAIMIVFALAVNGYYFSGHKRTKMIQDDEKSVMYLEDETSYFGFIAPYNEITGISVWCVKDTEEGNLEFVLMNEKYEGIKVWNISASDIDESEEVFLPFDDIVLKRGARYYLGTMSEGRSSIGILVSDDGNYGYGTSETEGTIWVYQIEYDAYSPLVLIFEMLIIVAGLIGIVLYNKHTKIGVILSVIYISIAFSLLIITPMGTSFDEYGHFLRTYEISEGHFVSQKYENGMGKSDVPLELIEGLYYTVKYMDYDGASFVYTREMDMLGRKLTGDRGAYANPNQALYSPASYIPQAIGLLFGRLVSDNALLIYYYGRFAAFLVNGLLILLAFNLIPEKSLLIFAVACNPVFLSQMVGYSADGTLNSLAIFFVAFILWVRKKEKIALVDKVILSVACIIIAMSKVIYFPLVLLILLVPDKLFKKPMDGKIYKAITALLSLIASVVWFVIAKSYLVDSANVRPDMQMKYILTHIYLFPKIIFNTIYDRLFEWISQMNGSALGAGVLSYKSIIWIPFAVLVAIELFTSRNNSEDNYILSKKCKILISAVLVVIIGLTFSSLYVQWTSYQADIIDGIQGRYFIPLLLPATLLIKKKVIEGNDDNRKIAEVITVLLTEICVIANTFQVYM